jgi:hypothetical protein
MHGVIWSDIWAVLKVWIGLCTAATFGMVLLVARIEAARYWRVSRRRRRPRQRQTLS